ncbi:hypothetical protein KKF61_04790 [Patescibacteria group bacterium]|nr:hypothetical protein [Patescibacteria group bacterium]MBU0964139.1 hypothetical protein [Patescibacteria group bacterium]
MVDAIHHAHIRKRIHKKHEQYPHPQPWKRFLDKIIYAAGIAGPIITIPQILVIWQKQDAEGVSLISWGGYLFLSVIWLIYGIAHKEKPIIVMYIANIIAQILVVLGIILYS